MEIRALKDLRFAGRDYKAGDALPARVARSSELRSLQRKGLLPRYLNPANDPQAAPIVQVTAGAATPPPSINAKPAKPTRERRR